MNAHMNKLKTLFSVTLSLLLLFSVEASMAQGNSQGNGNSNAGGNGKGNGQNKNIGVGNASDGIMGRLSTNKGVIYTGDPLEISVQFPRGAELITSGAVNAYVVVFAPTVVATDDADSTGSTDSTDSTDDTGSTDGTDGTTSTDGDDGTSGTDGTDGTDAGNGTADALSDPIVVPVSDTASEDATKLFEIEAVDLSTLAAGTYQLGLILTNPGGDPLVIKDWYTGLLGLIDVAGLTITDEAVDFDADGDGVVDDDADGDGLSDTDDTPAEEGSGDSDAASTTT